MSAINAGSFSLTGTGTTLTIAEDFDYGGTFGLGGGAAVSVAANGWLSLSGAATIGGAINGAGWLWTSGGSFTTKSGAAIGVSTRESNGETIDIGANLSYAGTFISGGGNTLDLASGTLTLAGALLGDGDAISGAKALILDGNTSVHGGMTIGGTGGVTVDGIVREGGPAPGEHGNVTLGDPAGDPVALEIGSSGTWDFFDDSGLLLGKSTQSSINNQGLFETIGGTSVSQVAPAIANSGTIEAAKATFDLLGAVTGTGSDFINGAATLEFGGAVSAGQTVSYAGAGGTLELASPNTFLGEISNFDAGGAKNDSLIVAAPWTFVSFVENSAQTQGVMTFADGAATTSLTLLGNYVASNFAHTTNAAGATVVTYG